MLPGGRPAAFAAATAYPDHFRSQSESAVSPGVHRPRQAPSEAVAKPGYF